ncbi:MAG: type I restriction endonuclease subunit R, EcoR124 family [Cytophagales bacterium]
MRYHGLIQAFSRTNRIYDATKTFGNIVTFRDLEKATIDAITLFGDSNTKNVVLEKSYKEYLEGFTDIVTGEARRGYVEVVKELNEKFPNPDEIVILHITASLKREYASENGTELNALLPKMSPLNPQYLTKKQSIFQKLISFVEKFKG